ncbi:MAG: efflux transporter outer membrane subunit [Alphaproteobacteria bacterium]|nr:efflux transporter outer membrane subunit [Alphaproteobacteria bacterium]MBU1517155.1 efflux transporter outer membrane subunit [Alphaproteobacteria bacterium]MBU2096512.1 efflux transporter outer membrane subunit [Alphaproteobacteria bacterium]MBU2151664.1 efflux transporter outer membrane subunit [Alphaproteobacteria bacterium]MBU2305458.1 efflux transporter outer membrane subunit [Alphaproteobacteria bacterium]
MRSLLVALMAATALGGCTLAPRYERPVLPVGSSWPTSTPTETSNVSGADLAWRDVFQDPRLQAVIALSLEQNRDLRVAVANIEQARAQYRIQRADLLPGINANGSYTRSSQPAGAAIPGQTGSFKLDQYTVSAGFSAYELDLFGRVRSLSNAALQSFFATEENRRAVQISLISEVANAYLTLAADQDLLAITLDTLASREAGLDLNRKRFEAGAASELDLRQVETLAEQARSDAAVAKAQVERDRNALRLLVGAEVPAAQLPQGDLKAVGVLADIPAGLPSEVLTRRPDVRAAEHTLQARNANIGAARAAFFPRITLTGSEGSVSPDLSGLFGSGTRTWSFAPQIVLPIFAGGANIANLKGAEAQRDAAVAQYEKAVQTAFREVSDALATRATINERIAAQERLVEAATVTQRLTQARYDRGVDSYLALLDAQRTLYAARQTLLAAQLARAANRVELYRALGGGAPTGTAPTDRG